MSPSAPVSSGKGRTRRRGGGFPGPGNGPPGKGPGVPSRTMAVDRPLGISQSLRRTLGYAASSSLTSTTGATSEATFTLNSAYHVSGSQNAVGFDKYMAFYSKCFVIGARIKVIGGANAIATAQWSVALAVSTNASAYSGTNAAIDQGFSQWTFGHVNPDRYVLEESVDTGRFLHKPRVLDDPQLFCTSSAQPGQLIVGHLVFQTVDGNTSGTYYMVEILLECVFTDPIVFT